MDTLTAPCGLQCAQCLAYVATQTGDPAEIERVAQAWSKAWGRPVRPEDVWCDGCRKTDGQKWKHAWNCEVRACGMDRGVATCAHCTDFVCETLDGFFAKVPRTRKILTDLHEKLQDG